MTEACLASNLKIMSYNLENLWDQDSENTPSVWRSYLQTLTSSQKKKVTTDQNPQYRQYAREYSNYYDPRVFWAKVSNFLDVLDMAEQPDVVALQEIESAGGESQVFDQVLLDGQTLRKKLKDRGYKTVFLGEQSLEQPVAVTTAFISKIPLKSLPSIPIFFGSISSSARQLQVVRFDEPAAQTYGRVVLINGHWKSQRNGGGKERKSIALAVQKRLNDLKAHDPDTQVLFLGDFNMPYWDSTFATLSADGNADVVRASQKGFYNLWFDEKLENRWDASFSGMKSPLSHMLIDHHFLQPKSRLKYVPGSFHVLGQTGPLAQKLLDVGGAPMRWQVHLMSWNYFYHIGVGYSDHLPLIAEFSSERIRGSRKVYSSEELTKPETPQMTRAHPCLPEETFSIEDVDLEKLEEKIGLCIRIKATEPLPLWNAPGGQSVVTLRNQKSLRPRDVAIGMVGAWDPYPNIHDSRVSISDIEYAMTEGWDYKRAHPRSNRCYVSKVLRSGAGRLQNIVGRLGYTDGVLRIHALSREPESLHIVDLPSSVESLCDWDKQTRARKKRKRSIL